MILNRLGNKTRIADEIVKHFPKHTTFIDMFFGAGGIYFNKPTAKYNFLNDIDDDVFNLYRVLQDYKDELIKEIELMPMSETLLKYWNTNKETEPMKKAIRFLMVSNFGYMGKPNSLHFSQNGGCKKKSILSKIEETFIALKDARFMCVDFRKVLGKINFREDEQEHFVYADPPYLGTDDNYSHSFTEQDAIDLFELLVNSKLKFAVSEFDNDVILQIAEKHNLNTLIIGERQNMKNRRTEILVTNYITQPNLFS